MLFCKERAIEYAQEAATTDETLSIFKRVRHTIQNEADLGIRCLSLTGSYRRGTQIAPSNTEAPPSDVDILAILPPERGAKAWHEKNTAVRLALARSFGAQAVEVTRNCLKLTLDDHPVPVDFITCMKATGDNHSQGGIMFWTLDQNDPRKVVNNPDKHLETLNAMDEETNGALRQLMRTVKQIRSEMIAQDVIGPATAHSYMIESSCMAMPVEFFSGDAYEDSKRYTHFMQYITAQAGTPDSWRYKIQHGSGLYSLIGDGHTQWKLKDVEMFVSQLSEIFKS